MANLDARVAKLEAAAVGGGVIVTRQRPDETEADAFDRLKRENPRTFNAPGVMAVLIRHFGQLEATP